ncbi:MAG: hypothetical protein WC389_00260 [Lutibacter sp.]|jgi:hypothetical protein
MRKPEETPKEKSPLKIESELAYWLDEFNGHLEFLEHPQMKLHSALMSLDDQCFTESEQITLAAFLNTALALTFIVKDNKEAVQKFIEYNT